MKKRILILLLSVFLFSCSSKPDLPVVEKVDIGKYMGTWYEIAALPITAKKKCSCNKIDFELADDKSYIRIIESCIKKEKQGAILGKAFVDESSGNAKWDVEHFWPFTDELFIIALADDYSWCMTGNPNRKELSIYSRKSTLADSLYNDLVKQASDLNFDTSRIVKVVHNCN